jgi:GNAT superfamily N-acetyltransferase
MQIVPLEPGLAASWAELFEACGSSCFCRYWHFGGSKNEWLARCAHDAARNREEQLACVGEHGPASRGLVAMEDGLAVGWMKLAPRTTLGKLTRLPVYKNLATFDPEGVYVIGCLLVRPDRRRQGVARRLVQGADDQVRAWGGRAIEVYPRHADAPLHDEEAWMGPERLFVECDYEVAAWKAGGAMAPYPVYRKPLRE